jgi:hypothetical protein
MVDFLTKALQSEVDHRQDFKTKADQTTAARHVGEFTGRELILRGRDARASPGRHVGAARRMGGFAEEFDNLP